MTSRRNIFKLFAGAVMASAMEVLGLRVTPSVEVASYGEPWIWRNLHSEAAANHDKYYAALMMAYEPQPYRFEITVPPRNLAT